MSSHRPLLIGFVAACLLAAGATTGAADPSDPAHLAYKTHDAEQFKTIPIEKDPDRSPKTLITLGPSKVGGFHAGDMVRAQGEFEMTICLKAHGPFPQSPCVGKVYGYDPKLTAQLVLSPSTGPSSPRAVPISRRRSLQCSQHIPGRNRHCLLTVPPAKKRLTDDCSPCNLHLVVSASHPRAKHGHKVTMGSFDDNLSINQNRAGLSMLRLRGTTMPEPDETTKILRQVKLEPEGQEGERRTIYSLPIRNPRAGDTYWVESKFVARVGHLPYDAAIRNELMLGAHVRSNDPQGVYGPTEYPVVSPRNGWTCTKANSGHETPCAIQKGGVLRFDADSNKTYHLNLTVGASASMYDGQNFRGGSLRFSKGYLRLYKFDNTL